MEASTQLQYTPPDAIPRIVSDLRNAFHTGKTHPLEWRKQQLRKLYWGVKDNENRITEALCADFHKAPLETYLGEVAFTFNDILYVLENMDEWAKEETAGREIVIGFNRPRVRKEPLGVVCIIA